MMNIAIALLLAANLNASGKPTIVVQQPNNQASVYLEGRPGCHAEPLHGDASNPVIVCEAR